MRSFFRGKRTTDITSKEVDIVARDWIDGSYYSDAESEAWLGTFWNKDSLFYKEFLKLDHSVIVDLACGHGRHSWQMRDWNNHKILVDVVKDNIEFCRNKFSGIKKVSFVLNNGMDMSALKANSCTALFTYDAAVHFSHIVVYNYLIDTFRILTSKGMALYHHSNYSSNPGGDYRDNPCWRNFMPPGLFIDYAKRVGFEIVEHHLLDWNDDKQIDALTLLRKP
jgi:hypothetical protein